MSIRALALPQRAPDALRLRFLMAQAMSRLFNPANSQDASAVDVVATITKLRPICNSSGERIYSVADFEVQARRIERSGARTVTLPYFSTVVQGGTAVVAKRVGQVTLNFADGQDRATATGKAASYIDGTSAALASRHRRKNHAQAQGRRC